MYARGLVVRCFNACANRAIRTRAILYASALNVTELGATRTKRSNALLFPLCTHGYVCSQTQKFTIYRSPSFLFAKDVRNVDWSVCIGNRSVKDTFNYILHLY